jgi:nitrite reductase/ring-hydroxylating ferredoxin subunit
LARLVEVYRAQSEGEARMIWGLLESYGIRCTMAGEAISMRDGEAPKPSAVPRGIRLLVPATEVEKAHKVLELLGE